SGLSLSHLDTISQINSAASEYDIVMNLAKFKERHYEEVLEELKQVRSYVGKKPLKVIIESGVLDTEELIIATDLVAQSGADFIKTSTGFIPQSAEELIEQVAIIQNIIKLHKLNLEIKASGGVQTLDLAKVLIGLGATRLGTSHSTRIIKELEARG
ncbi:MAG: deoxyribose-phosphate aldolase, partial [Terriglobia bacterium]